MRNITERELRETMVFSPLVCRLKADFGEDQSGQTFLEHVDAVCAVVVIQAVAALTQLVCG